MRSRLTRRPSNPIHPPIPLTSPEPTSALSSLSLSGSALSSSVNNLVSASWVNLSPGESPLALSSANLNASTAKAYAADMGNHTLTPPGQSAADKA